MFDKDLIDSMPADRRLALRDSIIGVCESGIVEEQLARAMAQLAAGQDTEPQETLIERVRTFRKQSQTLRGLQVLGLELKRERSNDSTPLDE